ncbi:mannitol dehydrogenase family protein [Oryzobacter telluris]|uniref:mannitol dehydrogenase family protein n=1 Tax=Oryzobacter telluris TaxID=3149179 RepID=UPI00370DE21B
MTGLSAEHIHELGPAVVTPQYDRTSTRVGIVHFGVGGFHRAHQALYIDELLNLGDLSWGICGVGVQPFDAKMRDVLADQDRLYTLLTVEPNGTSAARVVGSIVRYLYAPDDPPAVLDQLADPAVAIVSLTITEGGYGINDATGEFDPNDPAVLGDLSGQDPPASALGYIVAGLAARRTAGAAPFTVMSCDNIQGNGSITRHAVMAFARRLDPDLAEWISDEVAFPNSMVDRITPVTDAETVAAVAAVGIHDQWPVRSESFRQWVLEDTFPAGRPALERVGVQLVADVHPYELMKLRLLNASHQAMSYLGILSGLTFVHEVLEQPHYREFLLTYMHREAIPTLDHVPGVDLPTYCEHLLERFGSRAIQDTLARQVVDASDRIPKFLLPVVAEQLRRDGRIACISLVLASWSVYLERGLDGSLPQELVDKRAMGLLDAVARESSLPGSFLDFTPVFGDLGRNRRLRDAFVTARVGLAEMGPIHSALAAVSEEPGGPN